jgi:hypothetical protein
MLGERSGRLPWSAHRGARAAARRSQGEPSVEETTHRARRRRRRPAFQRDPTSSRISSGRFFASITTTARARSTRKPGSFRPRSARSSRRYSIAEPVPAWRGRRACSRSPRCSSSGTCSSVDDGLICSDRRAAYVSASLRAGSRAGGPCRASPNRSQNARLAVTIRGGGSSP